MASGKISSPQILFVLTVDTEEEWDWNAGFPTFDQCAVQNTRNIPKFQAFCNEFGVKPTYFIDFAIAADAASVQRFREPAERGECEIGGHLHPWITPPFEEAFCVEHTHAINLPLDLAQRKIRHLTNMLAETFGARPRTFRSGRWGMNGALLKILAAEGYRTDSSVLPFYADADFSYIDAPGIPYWPDWHECIRAGTQREIFEIPVTAGFNRPNFRRCHKIQQAISATPWKFFHAVGMFWHLHLLRKLLLSPELANAANMITLVQTCLKKGYRIINMFLHSSSLLPGGSPYVRNEHDENVFYQNMAAVITYLKTHVDVRFCTLTEAQQHYLQEENT